MEGDRLLDLLGALVVVGLIAGAALLVTAGANRGSEAGDGPPQTDWRVERMNDTYVRLTLAGGGPVETGKVVVTVDGTPRTLGWSGTLSVEGGGLLRARPGRTLAVDWRAGPGSDRTRLFTRRLPNG